jgi:protein-tyrosine-phosphatase
VRPLETVLFLCPHNAAKSLLAVADFDMMAAARGLPFRADSAGTQPDDGPSPEVVAVLGAEGIDVVNHRPRSVTEMDLVNAHRVISMGCDLGDLPSSSTRIEQWDDIPPVSRDLAAARDAIKFRLEALVEKLAAEYRRLESAG